MKRTKVRRFATAVVTLGIAVGSFSLTTGIASASSSKHPKVGSTCTKSEVNETVTVGKTKLTCKEITLYEWQK